MFELNRGPISLMEKPKCLSNELRNDVVNKLDLRCSCVVPETILSTNSIGIDEV